MKKVPVIKPGCTVRVHQRIKEGGKERVQVFEGLVISLNAGNGTDKTFTVRKIVGGIGVEKIFPLYSKNITKIQVTKSSDVRRAKLYYMRDRSGKSARLKEKHLTEKDVLMEDFEEQVAEQAEENTESAENAEKSADESTKATEEPTESAAEKAAASEETEGGAEKEQKAAPETASEQAEAEAAPASEEAAEPEESEAEEKK